MATLHQQATGNLDSYAQMKRHYRSSKLMRHEAYTTLSDNEREFYGQPDNHPYERRLSTEPPKCACRGATALSSGCAAPLLDEYLRIKGQTIWYESVKRVQADLDSSLKHYNTQGPHQDRMMEGAGPLQYAQKRTEIDTEGSAL